MEVDLSECVVVVAGRDRLGEALRAALGRSGAVTETTATGTTTAIREIAARRGRLDGLVTLAAEGIPEPAAVEEVCRAAAAAMRRGGRIVNVASAFGMVAARGEAAASAAAAAIFSLTRALALEFGSNGIRINALAIGPTEGPESERLLSHTPLARPGTPAEMAAAVLFLLDPANSYMNGHVLVADGGWSVGYARDF